MQNRICLNLNHRLTLTKNQNSQTLSHTLCDAKTVILLDNFVISFEKIRVFVSYVFH